MKTFLQAIGLIASAYLFQACFPNDETRTKFIEPPVICSTAWSKVHAKCQPPYIPQNSPKQLAYVICERLYNCTNLKNFSLCHEQLLNRTGLAEVFAIEPDTLGELENQSNQGLIQIDTNSFLSCTNSLSTLSCDSDLLQSSITISNTATDFQNILSIFKADPNCRTIFSWKELSQ